MCNTEVLLQGIGHFTRIFGNANKISLRKYLNLQYYVIFVYLWFMFTIYFWLAAVALQHACVKCTHAKTHLCVCPCTFLLFVSVISTSPLIINIEGWFTFFEVIGQCQRSALEPDCPWAHGAEKWKTKYTQCFYGPFQRMDGCTDGWMGEWRFSLVPLVQRVMCYPSLSGH